MELERYLREDVIVLDVKSKKKNDAIREMVELLCAADRLNDADSVLKTVYVREADRSTGIGNGVAIPHARTNLVKDIFLAVGRSKTGIEWGSMDGKPVYFIFLVVGPEKSSEAYLQVLADISRLMSRASVRSTLLEAKSAAEVLKLVVESKARQGKI